MNKYTDTIVNEYEKLPEVTASPTSCKRRARQKKKQPVWRARAPREASADAEILEPFVGFKVAIRRI
jgi:hypothetical protein